MEEFLQNMKTLRYQMNDVEDQAAKISVEEQKLITTIDTLRKDLDSAKSETKRLKEDTDLMVKEKGEICSQILLKQRKLNEMELDSQSLSQTMTLILQEQANLSAKLDEKRTYYREVDEDLTTKFQKLQDWISACKPSLKVKDGINEEAGKAAFIDGNSNVGSYLITDNLDSPEKNLMENIDAAKTKFDSLTQMKSELVSEGSKVNQSIELMKSRMREYKPELKEMDTKNLKDEIEALLSDKAGENEYLQSLQNQIEMLKQEISNMVKCVCGMEYKVELGCAQ
ncbi:uncharacterized protein LOC108218719 isoform X3 [Daucus carota subsp. sativus]|uniref:uncharacterized protein LOC108218719 isoform X3 n=1 Tax=Daucus carota subsp. sativus TaxID=79200 RepID=UPI0007EFA48C|nr:PREDICTED: uncharacterized protein LOC108218719 isoform X1 [Daucus carota subsp. sativus]